MLVRYTDHAKGWNGRHKYVSKSAYEFLNKSQLEPGDLVMANVGDPGKAFLVPDVGMPMTLGPNSILIRADEKATSNDFLHYFFQSDAGRNLIDEISTGAAQKKFNKTSFRSLDIPLPPLEEQQRIVAVLDEAFEGLARARTHAEANLQNARELFESHLFDLFTHSDPSWKHEQLIKFCEKITVGHVGPMAKRYVSAGTPFLRSQNIRPFKVDLEDVKYIDEKFTKELGKSELRPGDVAIVRTGYPGTCAVIPDDLEVANCADLVIARTGPNLNPHFLALLLNSTYGKELVTDASVGAAQKHFNVGAAKKALFPFPPLSVQGRLVAQADELSAACDTLAGNASKKLQDLNDLRQSLLQKAFAGELT
ncbi:hypothetical protein EOI86_16155 [Hwanghaeella grinnelliae]|uniref:Type I restriction modification DNA specificity domain-containing protein n=2 Tax=Hwanghaeella grinnelliae TaxID=2500179 RepID=A0A437QR32_9PROT|nr:hypothetical protein EOI86_16155 [Hwanghaeella grinnelliae]